MRRCSNDVKRRCQSHMLQSGFLNSGSYYCQTGSKIPSTSYTNLGGYSRSFFLDYITSHSISVSKGSTGSKYEFMCSEIWKSFRLQRVLIRAGFLAPAEGSWVTDSSWSDCRCVTRNQSQSDTIRTNDEMSEGRSPGRFGPEESRDRISSKRRSCFPLKCHFDHKIQSCNFCSEIPFWAIPQVCRFED